ncbi:uncharacterized protein [Diadema setosum]|uniref:uncharacterized protein n=1 Tax=Diadema setosum TaxID=31175 RepID=UPI003B3B4FF6
MAGTKYLVFTVLLLGAYWPKTVVGTCTGWEDNISAVSGTNIVLPFRFSPFGSPTFKPTLRQVVIKRGENFSNEIVFTCNDDLPCQETHREGRYQLDIDRTAGANLTIYGVELDDEQSYRCDFSYLNRPGDSLCRRLRVQVPPRDLEIQDRNGKLLDGEVIVQEGDDLDVRCIARGAKPTASIAWYVDNDMVPGGLVNVSSNPQDACLNDTSSRLVIPALETQNNLQKIICKATIEPDITKEVNVTVHIWSQPDRRVWLEGLDDVDRSTTERKFRCGIQGGYPSPQITWFIGNRNVTMNSSINHGSLAPGHFNTSSELTLTLTLQDNEKTLRCVINHVALDESLTQEGILRVCALVDVDVAIYKIDTSSVILQSDIKPRVGSEAINCDLKTCNVNSRNVTVMSQCITTPVYNIGPDNYYQVPDLEPSTRYSHRLSCRNDCGETSKEIQITTLHLEKSNVENNLVRELVFVIIAIIVVSAFVIVVTVSIVLRTVVRGKISVFQSRVENEVIPPIVASPDIDRRWNNLYTIDELKEEDSAVYQEIKDSIISGQTSPTEWRFTRQLCSSDQPPELPPFLRQSSTDSQNSSITCTQDGYVPMSPKSDRYGGGDTLYIAMREIANLQ